MSMTRLEENFSTFIRRKEFSSTVSFLFFYLFLSAEWVGPVIATSAIDLLEYLILKGANKAQLMRLIVTSEKLDALQVAMKHGCELPAFNPQSV